MNSAPEPGVVLIVGGTGAIGRATALAFARQGRHIMVAGRSRDAGGEVVSQVREAGAEGRYLHCDLTDPASIENLGREAIQAWGRIDVAFNNAGWEGVAASTADIGEADWQRMLDIKLTGAWRCMKFQLGQMQKQGGGSIVNMAGSWGLAGFARYGAYCAAAHGLMGLTRTAALEYVREGIRINAVCPGAVDTPLLDRIFGGDREALNGFAESLPMGRIATPEEIAEAVVWLSSDAASYVNGHALELTGRLIMAAGLNQQQQQWYEQACARIDSERLKRLIFGLTDIHSPTGDEKEASRFLVEHMSQAGFSARYQAVTQTSGNALGRLEGSGEGGSLLLYAPMDTHLDGEPDVDVPWVGPRLRDDMVPKAQIRGDTVIGLGASNPKSMIASLTEAANCVLEAGVALQGDVIVGSAGGGMPWVSAERNHAGISSGVMHMLSHGITADMGVIFKPWCEVYYEHPGMAWFKVTVRGTMGYAGIPRGTPGFDSAIVPAAKLILELEEWLAAWPDRHTSEQIRPEGWIAAVRSGWPDKPAFPGAACELYIDLRTNPDQKMAEVEAEFSHAMRDIVSRHGDIRADWEMYVSCQGSRTDPGHWIVKSATRSWEEVNGKPYPGAAPMSGQTDAATICQLGIPLARIGYPYIGEKDMPEEFAEGLGGMGVAFIPDLIDPIRQIIYIIIDSCTRPREELNL